MRIIHPNRRNWVRTFCLSGLVEHGDRVSTVDEHQSADPLGVLSRVSHGERGAVRPPDEDRAFDPGRVDDPADVVDGRL